MSDKQRDREERQHVIEVLQDMVDWMEAAHYIVAKPERRHALGYAINSIETDLKYDLLYEETSGQVDKQADKSTTKNDLVVDWDSYKDVDGNSLDDLILEVLQNNFDCGNTYGYKVADEIIGLLPPATPQEPRKGHWVLTDVEGDKVWHCNCSECGKDPQDYVGGSENWWLIKSKLPKFCPNCGSDNREVKE